MLVASFYVVCRDLSGWMVALDAIGTYMTVSKYEE